MPKRKPPPAPKLWARAVRGRDWEIYLPTGETLREIDEIGLDEARAMAETARVFYIGYAMPALELTGDKPAIDAELDLPYPKDGKPPYNAFSIFGSSDGLRALVILFQH